MKWLNTLLIGGGKALSQGNDPSAMSGDSRVNRKLDGGESEGRLPNSSLGRARAFGFSTTMANCSQSCCCGYTVVPPSEGLPHFIGCKETLHV